ncbi:hypothetical protein BBP40_000504 [Aspergillus hancockii]|nr:hypothetical protein BBP40_000504 [Aspergillus hancockii]
MATNSGHADIVKPLMETSRKDNLDGIARQTLSIAAYQGHADIVDWGSEDIDTNTEDWWGFTPLHYAVEEGNEGVVGLLLEHGDVEVALKDGVNWTYLLEVAREAPSEIKELLFGKGQPLLTPL